MRNTQKRLDTHTTFITTIESDRTPHEYVKISKRNSNANNGHTVEVNGKFDVANGRSGESLELASGKEKDATTTMATANAAEIHETHTNEMGAN